MRKITVVITLLVVMALLNFAIYKRELHIKEGRVTFLRLAPVDPRSLMQGDYMALRFAMASSIRKALLKNDMSNNRTWHRNLDANDGFVVVRLDERKVATFDGIYTTQTLKENQMLLQYRIRAGKVKFATNAFFFEEGTAERYKKAVYGEFRVNEKHELLLMDMYDSNLSKIN